MPEVYRMLNISRTTYLTYCLNLKCLDLVWLSICLKNTEKSAESREQRAESREPRAVGGARREIKPTLQVVVGTDLYMALKIGTGTTTVRRGGPPGSNIPTSSFLHQENSDLLKGGLSKYWGGNDSLAKRRDKRLYLGAYV